MNAIEQPMARSSGTKLFKIIGCGCVGLIAFGILMVGGLFFGLSKILKHNDPYRDSIAAVESNPAAVAALGSPVKPGIIPLGSISTDNGAGEVNFRIRVSGPEGSGTIYVIGSKTAGATNWEYETWELDVNGGETIPLGAR